MYVYMCHLILEFGPLAAAFCLQIESTV